MNCIYYIFVIFRMWLIHEHCNSTSAIDKYWVFTDKYEAYQSWKSLVKEYRDHIVYESDSEDECTYEEEDLFKQISKGPKRSDTICHLTDGDYLVFSTIDSKGFGRRP